MERGGEWISQFHSLRTPWYLQCLLMYDSSKMCVITQCFKTSAFFPQQKREFHHLEPFKKKLVLGKSCCRTLSHAVAHFPFSPFCHVSDSWSGTPSANLSSLRGWTSETIAIPDLEPKLLEMNSFVDSAQTATCTDISRKATEKLCIFKIFKFPFAVDREVMHCARLYHAWVA